MEGEVGVGVGVVVVVVVVAMIVVIEVVGSDSSVVAVEALCSPPEASPDVELSRRMDGDCMHPLVTLSPAAPTSWEPMEVSASLRSGSTTC